MFVRVSISAGAHRWRSITRRAASTRPRITGTQSATPGSTVKPPISASTSSISVSTTPSRSASLLATW